MVYLGINSVYCIRDQPYQERMSCCPAKNTRYTVHAGKEDSGMEGTTLVCSKLGLLLFVDDLVLLTESTHDQPTV